MDRTTFHVIAELCGTVAVILLGVVVLRLDRRLRRVERFLPERRVNRIAQRGQ